MAFGEEVAVFSETNLGTRIVMTVPLEITAGYFKRKLENTHASCLSNLGEIQVHGLMVKRRSHFYNLAESVPMKYIFRDNQKPWFIHAETRVVNVSLEPSISNSIAKAQIRHHCVSDNSIEGAIALIQGEKKKIKKSRAKTDSRNLASGQTCLDKKEFLGIPSTSEPETIRSSSLSVARAAEMKNNESFIPKTPERKPKDSMDISEMICKKLTVAANNIRMQGKSHVPCSLSSSIFRSKTSTKPSLDDKTVTSAKFQVFEVPYTDD